VVAQDAGIRNQTWWNARPFEWYASNLERLLAPLELQGLAIAGGDDA